MTPSEKRRYVWRRIWNEIISLRNAYETRSAYQQFCEFCEERCEDWLTILNESDTTDD